jgi:hypothetical protein
MIGRHRISRRAFVGGAGATVALPFLPSLWRGRAFAQAAPPLRFLAYYVPCGIHMPAWTPAAEGAGYAITPILQPLVDAAVRDDVLVLTGLANEPARPDGPGDHASGTGAFLTCAHPYKTEGADLKNGISVDQVAAGVIGTDTPFPSLELGIEGGSSAGGCDSGYSCAYSRNIAWAGESTPLPHLTNPSTVFDRLFGGLDPMASAAELERRKRHKTSVLDYVIGDTTRLSGTLGATDRRKLDEYLTGLRALETRINDDSMTVCDPGTRPPDNYDYPTQVGLMQDLMVLALQCDMTRVITFMLGQAATGRSYDFIGVTGAHHELSHHQDDAAKQASLQTIDTWEVEQFATLLAKLKAIDEGGMSLLDNAAVFFSSEIEDGDSHSHYNLPVLVAGKLGGALNPGRHLRYADDEPIANLFTSLLQGLGVSNDKFGLDGTGPLPNLS